MGSRSTDKRKRLDSFDERILNVLAVDGRITWRRLAEHINLSQTPTLRRVHRLEKDNHIAGYAAVLNQEKIFGAASLIIFLTVEPQCREAFERQVVTVPEIVFCGILSDNIDYLASVCTETMPQAYAIIEAISAFEGVGQITSHPLLKAVARPPLVPNSRRPQR